MSQHRSARPLSRRLRTVLASLALAVAGFGAVTSPAMATGIDRIGADGHQHPRPVAPAAPSESTLEAPVVVAYTAWDGTSM